MPTASPPVGTGACQRQADELPLAPTLATTTIRLVAPEHYAPTDFSTDHLTRTIAVLTPILALPSV